ncbi:MAG TPA: BLUF domain-containing protein [Bdellovibrio sp.]|uniref:BLUF domain-containing protein n=1 Tax=Bdellovibrio sp. TaxID=28201 RepID=UPI002F00E9AF
MPKVFQLVYVSQAVDDLSYTDIREILEVSRKNNSTQNITGILILRDGYFLQVLEGEENSIRKLIEKIRDDDRNYKLQIKIETESDTRFFDNWSMAFLDGDIEANSTVDLIKLFDLCVKAGPHERNLIMGMVKNFRASAPDFK